MSIDEEGWKHIGCVTWHVIRNGNLHRSKRKRLQLHLRSERSEGLIQLQSSAVITRSSLSWHYIPHCDNSAESELDFRITTDTPTGELWGAFLRVLEKTDNTSKPFSKSVNRLNIDKWQLYIRIYGTDMTRFVSAYGAWWGSGRNIATGRLVVIVHLPQCDGNRARLTQKVFYAFDGSFLCMHHSKDVKAYCAMTLPWCERKPCAYVWKRRLVWIPRRVVKLFIIDWGNTSTQLLAENYKREKQCDKSNKHFMHTWNLMLRIMKSIICI